MKTPFIPPKPYDELLSQARRDLAACTAFLDGEGGVESETPGVLASAPLGPMRRDPEVTRRNLESADLVLRLAALVVVYDHWDDHPLFAPYCLRIAFEDTDEVARGLALKCLVNQYKHVDDPARMLKSLLQQVVVEEVGSLRHDAVRVLDLANRTLEQSRLATERVWRRAVGDLLDAMLSCASVAESFLTHADPTVRWVALGVLTFHWEPTAFAAEFAEAAIADTGMPLRVREMACQLLARYHYQSNNRRIGAVLARIALDEQEDPGLRKLAYLHLYRVQGVPAVESPDYGVEFPHDVDWAFVGSFLETEGR